MRWRLRWGSLLLGIGLMCSAALPAESAEPPSTNSEIIAVQEKLEVVQSELAELRARLDQSSNRAPSNEVGLSSVVPEVAPPEPDPGFASDRSTEFDIPFPDTAAYAAGFDKGFLIRAKDQGKNPYELRISSWMQFRHVGFARDIDSWTDNAGIVRPINDVNEFEVERGRLLFEGFFHDPSLQFLINMDSDTDDNYTVIFHDYWVNYEFSQAFNLFFGKSFVPGSRDWLMGARRTRFTDRSMATTFFRPDRSTGIWADGEPFEKMFYRVMVCDGFNSNNLAPTDIDTRLCYSASTWFERGEYGEGYSDLRKEQCWASRVGNSFTFASAGDVSPSGVPLSEQNFVRLSDGTPFTEVGALAPGVLVQKFDIYLYAVDAAAKWRGFSFNGEYFFRWIQAIDGNGPLPISKMYDHGGYIEGGYMLIPGKIEANLRMSRVFGPYGDAGEYAMGANWFVNGTHNWKFTFDATRLDSNPAQNTGPNLIAGEAGWLFRTQFQAGF